MLPSSPLLLYRALCTDADLKGFVHGRNTPVRLPCCMAALWYYPPHKKGKRHLLLETPPCCFKGLCARTLLKRALCTDGTRRCASLAAWQLCGTILPTKKGKRHLLLEIQTQHTKTENNLRLG